METIPLEQIPFLTSPKITIWLNYSFPKMISRTLGEQLWLTRWPEESCLNRRPGEQALTGEARDERKEKIETSPYLPWSVPPVYLNKIYIIYGVGHDLHDMGEMSFMLT